VCVGGWLRQWQAQGLGKHRDFCFGCANFEVFIIHPISSGKLEMGASLRRVILKDVIEHTRRSSCFCMTLDQSLSFSGP
jgi:hypothetical protein